MAGVCSLKQNSFKQKLQSFRALNYLHESHIPCMSRLESFVLPKSSVSYLRLMCVVNLICNSC